MDRTSFNFTFYITNWVYNIVYKPYERINGSKMGDNWSNQKFCAEISEFGDSGQHMPSMTHPNCILDHSELEGPETTLDVGLYRLLAVNSPTHPNRNLWGETRHVTHYLLMSSSYEAG